MMSEAMPIVHHEDDGRSVFNEMVETKLFRIINGDTFNNCPVYLVRGVLSGEYDSRIKIPLTGRYKLDELEKTVMAGMVLSEAREISGRSASFCMQCSHSECEYHG